MALDGSLDKECGAVEEIAIPTAWLDPRLRRARDVLATVMRGGGPAGPSLEVRLAASAAFTEIDARGDLPYPPAGRAALDITDAAATRDSLAEARALLLDLIADTAPEIGFGFAYAARELGALDS